MMMMMILVLLCLKRSFFIISLLRTKYFFQIIKNVFFSVVTGDSYISDGYSSTWEEKIQFVLVAKPSWEILW